MILTKNRRPIHFQPLAAVLLTTTLAAPGSLLAAENSSVASDTSLPEITVHSTKEKNDYAPYVSTVGGKTPTAIRDIPQSVTVVNRAVLDSQGVASLSDALRNVPGITLGGAEGGQIGNNINLRGFSARTDLYVDGMRDRGQYYRDTFALESVEVLKGPSSMLFGRGSTGGVINQATKQPELKNHNEISATVGTNSYARSTLDVNRRLSETSAFRVNVMAQHVESTRDVMENRDFAIAPSLKLGIGTPTQITLSALFQHNHDMPDYGINAINGRPANVRRDNYYGLTDDRTIQDVTALNAKIEHKFNSNVTFRNQTQFNHYKTDARETYITNIGLLGTATALKTGIGSANPSVVSGALATASGNPTLIPLNLLYGKLASHDRIIHDQSINNQSDLITKFTTGSLKHELITGLEIGHDTYENQVYTRRADSLPIISLTNPAYLSTPSGTTTTAANLAQSSANTLALYANDTVELNKQWKVVGGLRWDRYSAGITNTVSLPSSANKVVKFTSVRGGLIYQPTDTQSYYVSYGTSFNPSLEQLTVTSGQQDLGPEKSRSYEVGGKWDLINGALSLNSALFRIEKDNARSFAGANLYSLDGNIKVDGFEFGATGHITPQWQIIGGYTYLNAKIVKSLDNSPGSIPTEGKTLANTPRHSATLWSTYNVTKEWEVGGGATYMSDRYASNTNVVSIGNYKRLDATVAYHQPKYDLRLNVINLTNSQDYISTIPSDGGRSVPSAGRTALVTATYKF
ncbi:MAG: TonB-dependent siderophore receptor [Pseudomonadota bacterium]